MYGVLSRYPGVLPQMVNITSDEEGHYSYSYYGKTDLAVFGQAACNYLLWLDRGEMIRPVAGLVVLAQDESGERWIFNRGRIKEAELTRLVNPANLAEPKMRLFAKTLKFFNPSRETWEERQRALLVIQYPRLEKPELRLVAANTNELAGIMHELSALRLLDPENIFVRTFTNDIPIKKPVVNDPRRKDTSPTFRTKNDRPTPNPNADLIRRIQERYSQW